MTRKYQERMRKEFDWQVGNLLQKGYPELAGARRKEFVEHLEQLRKRVGRVVTSELDVERGHLPFVIVIKSDLVAAEKAMSLVEREGKKGFAKMFPHEPSDFGVVDGVNIPSGLAYLLVDIDRGKANTHLAPSRALEAIKKGKRSPLTIDEGIAIVTHYPEFLMKNNCFSLLASRYRGGDRRVPAIWITREKKPRLGWCWDGNPHSWLGSASCKSRLGK